MYPLPYWWNFTVSGPVLPNFYWNVKSQEERIKKICEDLWKLIQLYKLVVDAINDHERRIQYLEAKVVELEQRINELFELYNALVARVNVIEGRVDVVEQNIVDINNRITQINTRIDNLINDLPTIVKNIILHDEEVGNAIMNMIISITNPKFAKKMDKVVDETTTPPTAATTDDVATFGLGGQVKDSNVPISTVIVKNSSATENHIPTYDSTGGFQDSNVPINTVIVKNSSATENHIPTYDSTGGFQDSGKTLSDYQEKVTSGVENDVATFDAHGQVKDSGLPVGDIMHIIPNNPSVDKIVTTNTGGAVKTSNVSLVQDSSTSAGVSNNTDSTDKHFMNYVIRNIISLANDNYLNGQTNFDDGTNSPKSIIFYPPTSYDPFIDFTNPDTSTTRYYIGCLIGLGCRNATNNTVGQTEYAASPLQVAICRLIRQQDSVNNTIQTEYGDQFILTRTYASNSWTPWKIYGHRYERIAPGSTAEAKAQAYSKVNPASLVYIPEETT